jgi:hypothetical protein
MSGHLVMPHIARVGLDPLDQPRIPGGEALGGNGKRQGDVRDQDKLNLLHKAIQ